MQDFTVYQNSVDLMVASWLRKFSSACSISGRWSAASRKASLKGGTSSGCGSGRRSVRTICTVASHSSQGATADRVLVHVDTEQAHNELVNSRLAYVSVSRGRGESCPVSRVPVPTRMTREN